MTSYTLGTDTCMASHLYVPGYGFSGWSRQRSILRNRGIWTAFPQYGRGNGDVTSSCLWSFAFKSCTQNFSPPEPSVVLNYRLDYFANFLYYIKLNHLPFLHNLEYYLLKAAIGVFTADNGSVLFDNVDTWIAHAYQNRWKGQMWL
jgi:hypothetical protein